MSLVTTLPAPDPEPRAPAAETAWFETFNAAIGGAAGNPMLVHLGFEGLVDFATRIANRTRGVVQPISTYELRQSPQVQALLDAVERLLDSYVQHGSGTVDAHIGPLTNALAPFQTPDTENTP